jgi:MFS family permease
MSWYVSAYLLVTSAFILSFGKIYTYYSVKWTYLISLGLFELGSLICAITPSSAGLIVGRAVSGLGSAGLFPGSVIILSNIAPLHQRPLLTAFIGIMSGIATVTGPMSVSFISLASID